MATKTWEVKRIETYDPIPEGWEPFAVTATAFESYAYGVNQGGQYVFWLWIRRQKEGDVNEHSSIGRAV